LAQARGADQSLVTFRERRRRCGMGHAQDVSRRKPWLFGRSANRKAAGRARGAITPGGST
jgi:hypothetical protein